MDKKPHHITGYLDAYVRDPLVKENRFIKLQPEQSAPPSFESARNLLPDPCWEGHDDAIACYWKTWELAFRNLRQPEPGNGFIANFIDTAFNDCLFMWDSAFILMFARYGCRAFNFQRTLDNLYARQHSDGFITRELKQWDGADRFHRFDPGSTGPNVLPWCEWEYWQNFGDRERLAAVFPVLAAYHRWMRSYRTWQDGSYWSSGWGCGMDNCPRTPAACHETYQHGHMVWIDATLQALLSARMLSRMAVVLGRSDLKSEMDLEVEALHRLVNETLWDAKEGCYCDRFRDGQLSPVKHVGMFWALLAGVADERRRALLAGHLRDDRTFKRPHRVPSLAANHPLYKADGGYWRGSVWPSTNYMILRGLTAAGEDDLAAEIGANHHANVVDVFRNTGTLHENYAPERAAPGKPAKDDFVGWGGVPSVAVFLEYVLGLRADVPTNTLTWDVRLTEAHGVRHYPFATNGLLDLHCAARASVNEKPTISVSTNLPVRLDLRWSGGRELLNIRAGRTELAGEETIPAG